MLKTVLIVLVIALGGLLAVAGTRPDSFRVERSIRIQAPPERVFALINDLQAFNRWNPWRLKDPKTQDHYGATTAGPGARYGWESAELGTGSMEIVESVPGQRVLMKLDFVKPFAARNQAEFSLSAGSDGATTVTWAMFGPSPYLSKLMGLFFSMDKMVGGDFESGLATLRQLAEAR